MVSAPAERRSALTAHCGTGRLPLPAACSSIACMKDERPPQGTPAKPDKDGQPRPQKGGRSGEGARSVIPHLKADQRARAVARVSPQPSRNGRATCSARGAQRFGQRPGVLRRRSKPRLKSHQYLELTSEPTHRSVTLQGHTLPPREPSRSRRARRRIRCGPALS